MLFTLLFSSEQLSAHQLVSELVSAGCSLTPGAHMVDTKYTVTNIKIYVLVILLITYKVAFGSPAITLQTFANLLHHVIWN